MAEPTLSPELEPGSQHSDAPKAHFSKAVEEAMSGAQLLGKQAQERAEAYRDKFEQAASDIGSEARIRSDEARERALSLANDGKARASGAISGLGKIVEDNAALVDERVGVRYGDYVRTAGRTIQDAADRLDAKTLDAIAEDALEFVRTRPGLAVGIAAMSGFMLSRMFRGPSN